jgi:hypothetical protein
LLESNNQVTISLVVRADDGLAVVEAYFGVFSDDAKGKRCAFDAFTFGTFEFTAFGIDREIVCFWWVGALGALEIRAGCRVFDACVFGYITAFARPTVSTTTRLLTFARTFDARSDDATFAFEWFNACVA